MKKVLLAMVLTLIGSVVGCRGATDSTQQCNPSGCAAADGQEDVIGMGRVEPAGGVIDVGAMMGDRLGSLRVQEGDQVKKGDTLADLESRALRELELAAATSQLENAEGRLRVERQLANVKIEAAKLGVKKAEAAGLSIDAQNKKIRLIEDSFKLAEKDQKRLKGLSNEMVADQERERQELLVQQTASELELARATMKQLVCMNALGVEGAKLELAAAEDAEKQLPFVIPIESLRVSRKLAEAQYARTRVAAPCDGTILKTYVRPGETIGAKPILQMADLSRMVVVVEVFENQVKYVRLGQQALVASKAFPSPCDQKGLQGKVAAIGRMISVPMLKSVDPFAPADRHVVEVRVELDPQGGCQAAALSNLQVDVRFPKRD
jgi:HlyD family secretion protein